MMKTALTLCILYTLTSSQPPPMYVPVPADPVMPVTPQQPEVPAIPQQPEAVPVTPQQPEVPAVPVIPLIPIESTTSTTIQPVAPQIVPIAVESTTSTTTTTSTTSTSTTASTTSTTSTTLQPVAPQIVAVETSTTTTTSTTNPPFKYGAYGQMCAYPSLDAQCKNRNDSAIASGSVICEKEFDCCLCSTVQCTDCDIFSVGDSGIFGVRSVVVAGVDVATGGADIFCKGTEACTSSVIEASNIRAMACTKERSCKNASVTINNPANRFYLDCIGMESCKDLTINVNINAPDASALCDPLVEYETLKIGKISCVGESSCEGLDFRLTNNGCGKVEIETFNCLQHDACDGASFNFVGDIAIATCYCGASCKSVTGIEPCFENLEYLFCPDPVSCNGAIRSITNPIEGFILKCAASGSCEGAVFNIVLNEFSQNVEMFDGFMCGGPHSCDGAMFIIHNDQASGNELEIDKIECKSVGSCNNATFIIGEKVNIGTFDCNPMSCDNCVIKTGPNEPGIPCNPNAEIQNVAVQIPANPSVPVAAV